MPTWHEGLASARDASLSHNKMPFPVSAAAQAKANTKRAPEMSPAKRAAKRASAAAPPVVVASGTWTSTLSAYPDKQDNRLSGRGFGLTDN